MTNTIQQRRAAHASNEMGEVAKDKYIDKKKYAALVRGFPMLIRTDGLAPALTFLDIKGDAHGLLLLEQISRWVLIGVGMEGSDLLEKLSNFNSTEYRAAVLEAIAYTVWLKRFTEAQGWDDGKDNTTP